MMDRRSLITGLISLVAAPAIIRATSLMPIRVAILPPYVGDVRFSSMHSFSGLYYWEYFDGFNWLRVGRLI